MSGRPRSIAILGEPEGWHVGRLAEAATRHGHQPHRVRWDALATAFGGRADELFLPHAVASADVVLVRGMPTGGLEEVIFRMNLLARLAAGGHRVVNSPRSLELAIDKHLSLALLAVAGLPVPRSHVAQTPEAIRAAWESLGGDAVVKPIFGSRGKGIERLDTRQALDHFLKSRQPGTVAYLQEFIPHGNWDARVLLIGERTFAMKRVSDGDWRTNVARGARAVPFALPAAWLDLAMRTAAALGTSMAGIDLVEGPGGKAFVIEANAVPGWRGLETVVAENIADVVIAELEKPGAK